MNTEPIPIEPTRADSPEVHFLTPEQVQTDEDTQELLDNLDAHQDGTNVDTSSPATFSSDSTHYTPEQLMTSRDKARALDEDDSH
jgi:hypothetical protein